MGRRMLAGLCALLGVLCAFPAPHALGKAQDQQDHVPVFAGFEDARYQEHDLLLQRLLAEFAADREAFCGCSAASAATIPLLPVALVKAWIIQESGGTPAAWNTDPAQMNVPGDWVPEKELLGLSRPAARHQGNVEDNLRAAMKALCRKGFGASYRPTLGRRDGAHFDGWARALERYNANQRPDANGKPHSVNYAQRILQRAQHPQEYVPIRIPRRAAEEGAEDANGPLDLNGAPDPNGAALLCMAGMPGDADALASAPAPTPTHTPASVPSPLITEAQAHAAAEDPDVVIRGTLNMTGGVPLPYAFSITNKGHGTLTVANLMLNVYDHHADDDLFVPPLLEVTPIRDDAGLCVALQVRGQRVRIHELTWEHEGREDLLLRCDFDPVLLRFATTGFDGGQVVLDR